MSRILTLLFQNKIMDRSTNSTISDNDEKAGTSSAPTVFPECEFVQRFDENLDIAVGPPIEFEIQDYHDEIEIPSDFNLNHFIVFHEPLPDELSHNQNENITAHWFQNETTHLGIEDSLLPCLQDLLELPFSSNSGDQNIESNEMIHFDGSEYDVPSVLEDAGIAEFSVQEEVGLGGMLEIFGTRSGFLNTNTDEQLLSSNEGVDSSRIKIHNTNESENGDLESEGCSEIEYTRNVNLTTSNRKLKDVKVKPDLESSFIVNHQRRRARFLQGWKTLQAKIQLMNARTGTTCSFQAILDAETFTMSKRNHRDDSITEKCETFVDASDGNETDDDDDHSYAAVIVTQKVSSRTVSDHQYNQRASSISETDEISNSSHSKPVFIKRRYVRERQLVSFLSSLFSKIHNLKSLTGATILLKVGYENHMFTENNYKEAETILVLQRKGRFRVSAVPVIGTGEESNSPFSVVVEKNELIEGSRVHVRFIKKQQRLDSCMKQDHSASIGSQKNKSNPSSSAASINSSYSGSQCTSTTSSLPPPHFPHLRRSIDNVELPDHWYGLMDSKARDLEDNETSSTEIGSESETRSLSGPPSISASVVMMNSPEEADPSIPSSPSEYENTNTASANLIPTQSYSTRDAGTSTELMCMKCSSAYPPSTSRAIAPIENLWIRCFDPFCHHVVHPSCIGFHITSPMRLESLPPYFCENHR